MSKPLGPYSPVVRSGDLIFVSGQVGIDADGVLVGGGVSGQTARVLENLAARLDEAGASMTDVVKTTCFLADMEDFAAFNTVYAEAFADHRPARSTVAVAGLPIGALVEVEAIARLA